MKNRTKTKIFSSFLIFVFFCSFLFSGIEQRNINAATTFTYDNLEYKEAYGALWVKVFYHYSGYGTYFANEAEALSCNSTYKYSILNRLDDFKVGNTYEFLLEYPQLSGYNRWTQTSNPTTTTEFVEGYNPISISFSDANWKGLCKSSATTESFLDGHVGYTTNYFAIGDYRPWPSNGYFPGPSITSTNITTVKLWMRVDGEYNAYDEYEKLNQYSATWAKVFYHNSRNGLYWTVANSENPSLVPISNRNDLFSKMNILSEFYINNKYEFLLLYPEVSGYNRWSQTSNPYTSLESVAGYTPISISWSGNYWGGIAKAYSSGAYFDGSPYNTSGWFSLGRYSRYATTTGGYSGFPGPNDIVVSQAALYVRIDGKDIIEPTINVQNFDDTSILASIPITIDASDTNKLSKIIVNGTTYTNSTNTNTFSIDYTINENGLYKIDAYDESGNIERKVLYVTNINKETPSIDNVTFSHNESYFTINTNLSSTQENFKKIKYCLSDEPLETSSSFTNSIETFSLSFDTLISNSNKYLNLIVINKNGLESEVFSIKLNASFEVKFYDNGSLIDTQTISYGESVIPPTISKEGYSLSWDSTLDNITKNTTINAIWTIFVDNSSYSIIIPKTLVLDSKTKKADYVVGIKGTLEDGEVINIIPDNGFDLHDVFNIKSPVSCTISQENVMFDNTIINNNEYYYENGYVLANDNLSAGEWYGIFNFNISKTLLENTMMLESVSDNSISDNEISVSENKVDDSSIIVKTPEDVTPTPTVTPIPTIEPTPTPETTPSVSANQIETNDILTLEDITNETLVTVIIEEQQEEEPKTEQETNSLNNE